MAAGMTAPAAWAQTPEPPRFQPKAYFEMPLEKDPTRQVRLQSVVIPAGAGNQFHRHPGDQWWAVQEGEVVYTIKGQPPRTLKPGEFVHHVPRGTVHRNPESLETSRRARSSSSSSTRTSRRPSR